MNSITGGLVACHLQGVQGVLTNMPLSKLAAHYQILLEDLQLVCSVTQWTRPSDRTRIRTTIERVIWGALDNLGIPRFELPAEYIAAWIAVMVQPVNRLTACAMFGQPRVATELAADPLTQQTYEGVTPMRLFAIVHIAEGRDEHLTAQLREQIRSALFNSIETQDQLDADTGELVNA